MASAGETFVARTQRGARLGLAGLSVMPLISQMGSFTPIDGQLMRT